MALAPFLLPTVLLFVVTLKGSPSAAQPTGQGFQSINCGGETYIDPITTLNWEEDPFNKFDNDSLLHGIATKVDSQYLQNITHIMQTLRYFPSDRRNKKFCYSFPVSNGRRYLIRASFLYGNYDKRNDPPFFVLLLNYDHWIDVIISSSTIPIVHELIFLSKGYSSVICLARQFNSTHAPFISTLEIRPLKNEMYNGSTDNDHGPLMLVQRINYGTNTNATIRFPDDEYDRIWEANTTGPIITRTSSSNTSNSDTSIDYERPPPKVMATAITTQHPEDNLTFVFEGFGGTGGFRIQMHFQEVEEVSDPSYLRNFSLAFPTSLTLLPPNLFIVPAPQAPFSLWLDQQLEIALPFQIALIPAGTSAGSNARGPLLNAIELYRWTPQQLSVIGTFQDDVNAINQVIRSFKLSGYSQGDPCAPNGYSWTWIVCNNDTEAKIVEIDLASFNLTGDIPASIGNLEYLKKIDLSNNMLTGEIPNFTSLVNLEYLDLHNNKLEGELPQSLLSLPNLATLNVDHNDLCGITSSGLVVENFSYIGNPKECQSLWSSNLAKKVAKREKYIYPFSCFGSFIIGSLLTYALLYMKEKSRTKHQKIWEDANGSEDLSFTKMFTYKEICNATQHFSILLGKGGFGEVYYGMLSCGKAIAVKTLVEASKNGLKQFATEVAILSSTRHKNLVCLIGYCMENTHMLVYEYVSKGNLKDLMSGKDRSIDKPLPWTTRLQIAIDASQGLEYLHTGCDPMIIHRDIKSSNILLTDKLQAKVADFGLSRLKEGNTSISHVSTMNVVGTVGYFDPAYVATNQLTDKSDVYGFGIVLFELISGRPPIDYFSATSHIVDCFGVISHIVDWVTLAIDQGKVEDIVDPMIKHAYKVDSLKKVVDMAFRCVENDRLKRPNISEVTLSLKEALEIEMENTQSPLSENMSDRSSPSNGELHTLKYNESL